MTVGLAGIGLGGLGRRELEVYADMDDVEIIAGADVAEGPRDDFEATHEVPTYPGYEVLLEKHAHELDAVTIVTPHTLHHEQAKACFEAGLDVFLEKPMVTSVPDAHDLIETADRNEAALSVGYQRHFHPVYKEIKRRVDDGQIGDVHQVTGFLGQNWIEKFPDAWRTNPDLSGGGQLYDSGSHLLDSILWTTGTTPETVTALLDQQGNSVDVNSTLAIQLDRDGQTVTGGVTVTGDGAEDPGTHEGLVIWGTEGRLEYTNGNLYHAQPGGETTRVAVETDPDFRELLERKLGDFVEAVRGEHEPSVPGEYGVKVTALTEAAYESVETGKKVDVSESL